jgi:hypothetical protein
LLRYEPRIGLVTREISFLVHKTTCEQQIQFNFFLKSNVGFFIQHIIT